MKISPNCYAVTGLAATPPWIVNAGFAVGSETTLIVDTGMNTHAAQTIAGYAKAVRPQNKLIVINSEPHFDHIGGNSYFARQGIDIYGHPKIKRTAIEFAAEKAAYRLSITNSARLSEGEEEVVFAETDLANPNEPLNPEMHFDLGGISAEVLATPGHTPLNMSIYIPAEKVLFCGDCIVGGYIPNLEAGMREEWHKWHSSLDQVEELAPNIVVPGHGNVLSGDEIGIGIQRMRRFIRESIASGTAPTHAKS